MFIGFETEKQRTCEEWYVFEGDYWNKLEVSWQKGILIVLLFEAEHPSVLYRVNVKIHKIMSKEIIEQKTKQFIKAGHTIWKRGLLSVKKFFDPMFSFNLQMLQFWHKNNLPFDGLECFLSEYLDILGYPLSLLMIRLVLISWLNALSLL